MQGSDAAAIAIALFCLGLGLTTAFHLTDRMGLALLANPRRPRGLHGRLEPKRPIF
jgi:hypothetical protein